MRSLIFILLGLVAIYAAPVAEENDAAEFMAEIDSENHLFPMEDEESAMVKRSLSDEDLENRRCFQSCLSDLKDTSFVTKSNLTHSRRT